MEQTLLRAIGVLLSVAISCHPVSSADRSATFERGKEIYSESCAECHAADGAGVEGIRDERLQGDLSIAELEKLIERTMPEGDAESCVGEEAHAVAAYIHESFYSLDARIRTGVVQPPRVELVRLTVEQYRNAIADLIGHFTPAIKDAPAAERGLRAEYYQSKGMSKADKRKLERVEPRVDYNFGEGSPSEDISADQFAIIWNGSIEAPATGFYEFRVRTENGARLYLNNDPVWRRGRLRDDSSVAGQDALIDAWVSSGKMREHTARVFLISGRSYPIRLEFFKYKEKTSSIRLEWKPPNETWSLLDHDYAKTDGSPRTFVVTTQFPADDRSLGYERGSSVSPEWHVATNNAAIETVSEVIARLPLLTDAGREDDKQARQEKLVDFVGEFARVAYRRPLESAEQEFFRRAFFNETADVEAAARRALLYVVKSPQFLYVDLDPNQQEPSAHTVASRLAFALWDSIPDRELFQAADDGNLLTRRDVEMQARRMLTKPQAREKVRAFFRHWLELGERDLSKDAEQFPQFNQSVAADLRFSLMQFLDGVVWSDSSDYRQLLLADYLLLNDSLGLLYASNRGAADQINEDDSDHDSFRRIEFSNGQRAGVLTHPYLLSAFSYHNSTSPIHRGVFVTRNIVGRGLRPPPIAVAFKNDEFAPDLTMREKITQLTRDQACMSCHSLINPLGFALENYDAIGRWRTEDNNKPVDTTGEYVAKDGTKVKVSSAVEIAEYAVKSEAAHRAFVSALFHQMIKQDAYAYGTKTLDKLRADFVSSDFNIQELMIQIATIGAMHGVAEPSP